MYGLPPEVGEALVWQESRGNPNALSRAGAIGLGQLMPATAKDLGVNPNDPMQNLHGSMRYLSGLVRDYGMENGLAAYNGGAGRLQRAGYNLGAMPIETQGFVPSVLNRAAELNGGSAVNYDPKFLKMSSMRMFPQEMYLGQPEGNFKAKDVSQDYPEAMNAINEYKQSHRAMLPLAIGNLLSNDSGSQALGRNLYATAVSGMDPMKLPNGYVMDGGQYITDQDPSALYSAYARMAAAQNAAGGGEIGMGTPTQIGITPDNKPIFKGKHPTPFTYEGGQPVPYTGASVDPKSGNNPTEDQSKAAGWYKQAEFATKNMSSAIDRSPSAMNEGAVEYLASLVPVVGDRLANYARSDDRQQFVQAAGSFAEAALRAATGAGVNLDEARQKIAELTPQLGNSEAVIKQKMAAWQVYLDSIRVRAGRALSNGQNAPAGTGQVGANGAGSNAGMNVHDPYGIRQHIDGGQ